MAGTMVLIEIIRDADLGAELETLLTTAGVKAEPASAGGRNTGVRIPATTMADCRQAGKIIAAWVKESPHDFKLRIDGPRADSTLHRLRTSYDEEMICESIAAAVGLQ